MSRAFDESMRPILRRIFADHASNVPDFSWTAKTGGHRRDEGLQNLLPSEMSLFDKQRALKKAVVAYLDSGAPPEVGRGGDREMKLNDAEFFCFRVSVAGVALFVESVILEERDGDDPNARIVCVKQDDRRK